MSKLTKKKNIAKIRTRFTMKIGFCKLCKKSELVLTDL